MTKRQKLLEMFAKDHYYGMKLSAYGTMMEYRTRFGNVGYRHVKRVLNEFKKDLGSKPTLADKLGREELFWKLAFYASILVVSVIFAITAYLLCH